MFQNCLHFTSSIHTRDDSLTTVHVQAERQTALHIACANDNVDMVKNLIAYGADISSLDVLTGWNAVHMAGNHCR